MSERPVQPESRDVPGDDAGPPTSQLAVVALICSAFFCCPVTSIIGVALGFRALRVIQLSEGRLGGVGMARLALLLGTIGIAAQCVGINWGADAYEKKLRETIIRAIELTLKSPDEAFDRYWERGSDPEKLREDLRRFAADVRERDGEVELVQLTTDIRFGAMGSSRISAPVTFTFPQATRIGGATLRLEIRSISPRIHLRELVITDRERGDLRIRTDSTK